MKVGKSSINVVTIKVKETRTRETRKNSNMKWYNVQQDIKTALNYFYS